MRPAGWAGWYGCVAGSRSSWPIDERLAEGGDRARLDAPGRCARGRGVRNGAQAAGLEAAPTADDERRRAQADRRQADAPPRLTGRSGRATGSVGQVAASAQEVGGSPHPGGQAMLRPPIRCQCRWSTDWPPQSPTLLTRR